MKHLEVKTRKEKLRKKKPLDIKSEEPENKFDIYFENDIPTMTIMPLLTNTTSILTKPEEGAVIFRRNKMI